MPDVRKIKDIAKRERKKLGVKFNPEKAPKDAGFSAQDILSGGVP